METPNQPRSIDSLLSTCRDTQCHSHGTCVPPQGGGTSLVCDCDLGYRGEFCDGTVNGALSVPLCISVVAILIGLLLLSFIIAKMRQRQNKTYRRRLAAQRSYRIAV